MFYLVSTTLNKDKLSYDIIEEFKTIKEAYDYLYKNGYKKYNSNIKFKSNHYYNNKRYNYPKTFHTTHNSLKHSRKIKNHPHKSQMHL